jgi:hypothetical protein
MKGSKTMTTTSLGFGDIDKDRHLLSVLSDIINCGGAYESSKPFTMPLLSNKIEIMYATLIAMRKSSTCDDPTLDLISFCISHVDEVRRIIRDLNGDEYDEEPQIRLTRDKDSNYFLLNEETGVLTPWGNLSDKR